MRVNQYIERLDTGMRELEREIPNFLVTTIAKDAIAWIRTRLINTGTDAKGKQYSFYSTRPLWVTRSQFKTKKAYNEVAGSKAKQQSLSWMNVDGTPFFQLPGGYKQYRAVHGLQTDHKSFWFTGAMLKSIKLVGQSRTAISYSVTVGTQVKEERDKLEGNTAREVRRGNTPLLDLSQQEQQKLEKALEQMIIKYIGR